MRLAVAYALAILSAGLAAFYGWASAEGWQAGTLKAAILAAVAFIGCHGPAFVSEAIDDRRWGRAAFNLLVTAVCFAVSLAGGMGTIAGAGESVKAQRVKAADDTNRDKDSLTTKRAERAKLDARPLAAIQADLTTAKAGRLYRATDGCEPEKVVAKCGSRRAKPSGLSSAKLGSPGGSPTWTARLPGSR